MAALLTGMQATAQAAAAGCSSRSTASRPLALGRRAAARPVAAAGARHTVFAAVDVPDRFKTVRGAANRQGGPCEDIQIGREQKNLEGRKSVAGPHVAAWRPAESQLSHGNDG